MCVLISILLVTYLYQSQMRFCLKFIAFITYWNYLLIISTIMIS